MPGEDMRYYETFYGVYTDHWDFSYGNYSNHHYLLIKEYISEGCLTTDSSTASDGDINTFVYQNHIKRKYFIEGVIEGHVTLAASSATSTVTSYRVTVGKANADGTDTDLFSTGWVTVNDTLEYDSTYNIGSERVYWFQIDAWQKEELGEYDRIYVKVETDADSNCVLWHSNDATWEDVKITIPFVM